MERLLDFPTVAPSGHLLGSIEIVASGSSAAGEQFHEQPHGLRQSLGAHSPLSHGTGSLSPSKELVTRYLTISGMTCAACSSTVEKVLAAVEGVAVVSVSLTQNVAEVVFDANIVMAEDLVDTLDDMGYEAHLQEPESRAGTSFRVVAGRFRIQGMTCATCVGAVEQALIKVPGVKRAAVALATAEAEVEYDSRMVGEQALLSAIEDAGYEAAVIDAGQKDKVTLSVDGMEGEADRSAVVCALLASSGVREARVSPESSDRVQVVFNPDKTGLRAIFETVKGAGEHRFRVTLHNPAQGQGVDRAAEIANHKRLFFASLVLTVPVFLLAMIFPRFPFIERGLQTHVWAFSVGDWLRWGFTTPIEYVIGWRFHRGAWRSLRHGYANMDVLIVLGTNAAYWYSVVSLVYAAVHPDYHGSDFFETAAMLITFILLGKYLEVLAKGRTGSAISALLRLAPTTATLLTLDATGQPVNEQEIEAFLIQKGDVLKVQPGAKVPADGVVLWGSSHVNESMITGEARPVSKQVGDSVITGTLNTHGALHIRAVHVGGDTALAQIVRMVKAAQMSKAPIQKFADCVSGIFVPLVVLAALLTWLGWYVAGVSGGYPSSWLPPSTDHFLLAFLFGISVLVIACPCALGLATPTAVMVATGIGASNGILIKGGEALEKAHNVRCVAFDKTGTLTVGRPTVTAARDFGSHRLEDVLALAAAAEAHSEHPLATAILAHARHVAQPRPLTHVPSSSAVTDTSWVQRADEFEAIPGQGVRATVGGKEVLVGNRRLMDSRGVVLSLGAEEFLTSAEARARTGVLVAVDRQLAAGLAISDPLKPEAPAVVEALRKMGIRSVMMTGDNVNTARVIADEVGISTVYADLLPADKVTLVQQLQLDGTVVAMVGDGINDSPALAAADVGLAIGAGTDIAVEAADCVLIKSNLEDVITAIDLSRVTFRRILLNYGWAVGYNLLGIPIAAGALYPGLKIRLPPWVAGAAMAFSSVSVVCSSILLRRYRRPRWAVLRELAIQ